MITEPKGTSKKGPRTVAKSKVYTDAKCPQCGAQLFSSVAPWEAKKGQKIKVDTCLTHGKVA